MKNYYIVLPISPAEDVYSFVETNKDNFINVGGNNQTLEVIANPANPLEASFRFELSEEQYLLLEAQLLSLGADVSESAEVYLSKYPYTDGEDIK